jgi:tetratricopeptide (TPR) repeat protein
LLALLLAPRLCAAAGPTLLDDAFHDLYNFNFPAAQQAVDTYIAAHPQEPLPYAVRASGYLFYELDRLGILESEFLIDDKRIIAKKASAPDPVVRAKFLKAVEDAQSRADAALAVDPNDKMALLSMCISQGVTTDYMALVEKHQILSLAPAKKSNNYAQRLLKLDPKFYDAYLAAGFSEYMVGSLPFFIRWFVHFDNVSGDKKTGISNLELVASDGHYLKPFAKILLGIVALREKRPRDAQKLLQELARNYPQNPLFRKELDKLNERIGAD